MAIDDFDEIKGISTEDEFGGETPDEKSDKAAAASIQSDHAQQQDKETAQKLKTIKILLKAKQFVKAEEMIAKLEEIEEERAGGCCENPDVYWCKVLLKFQACDDAALIAKMPDLEEDGDFALAMGFSKTDEQLQYFTSISEGIKHAKEEEVRKRKIAEIMQRADEVYKNGDYKSALELYNQAVSLGSEEAQQKALQTTKKIEEEERNSKIAEIMQQADKSYKNKSYKKALRLYQEAASLGSEEAQQKANQTSEKIEEEERNNKIAEIMQQANGAYGSGDYKTAIELYSQAASLGCTEAQKNIQLAKEGEERKRELEERNRKIAEIMQQADEAYKNEDYKTALELYNQAVSLGNTEAQQKANQTSEKIEEEERKRKIAEIMPQADEAYNNKDYQTAQRLYQEAANLGCTDAQEKVNQVSKILKEEMERQYKIRVEEYRKRELEETLRRADEDYKDNCYESAACWYIKAVELGCTEAQEKADIASKKAKEIKERASEYLRTLGDYKDIGGGYITFGTYPQSRKADEVTIVGTFDKGDNYYIGSDNCIYVYVDNSNHRSYSGDWSSFGYCSYGADDWSLGYFWSSDYYKVEPIKWKTFIGFTSLFSGVKFAIAENILDGQCFANNEFYEKFKEYKDSRARDFINGKFFGIAFSDTQKEIILTTEVDNSSERYGKSDFTKNEDNTNDKVFLLSCKEVERYLSSSKSRKRVPTDYATAMGAGQYSGSNSKFTKDGKGCGRWWLRSCAYNGRQLIYSNGDIGHDYSQENYNGIVPAIRIKPQKTEEKK